MIRCPACKGEPFYLARPRYDLRPVANAHRLGFTVDGYCDVFAFTVKGHGSVKTPRKRAMRLNEGYVSESA